MRRVHERAAEGSANFIEANIDDSILFDHRSDYCAWLVTRLPNTGLLLEAGVFEGQSINFIADWLKAAGDARLVQDFDSFEGLEEDWTGEALPAGFFDQGGRLPHVRDNVHLHKGWVQDTVQPFLDELIGYPNWQAHEAKALDEILPRERCRFIAYTSRQAAIRIL